MILNNKKGDWSWETIAKLLLILIVLAVVSWGFYAIYSGNAGTLVKRCPCNGPFLAEVTDTCGPDEKKLLSVGVSKECGKDAVTAGKGKSCCIPKQDFYTVG